MNVIEIKNLTKIYPDGTKANDNISIKVKRGEIVGIVGPNGAGKTTLIRQLLGLLKPTEGVIKVMGKDVTKNPTIPKEFIGYVPQYPLTFPSLTVREILDYVLRMRGVSSAKIREEKISNVLHVLNLENAREFFGYQLSGGMRKTLLLAMALIQELPILVLDEPTSMVDVVTKYRLWEVIREHHHDGVLIASHDMTEVKELCNRIYILVEGRIITSGTPADIVSLMKMPTEVKIIPREGNIAGILPKNYNYTQKGKLYEISFETLEDAIKTIEKVNNTVGISYLELNSPSFEKLIVNLLRRDG
ncbi:ABC-type multidrug transport system, ATPase component [Pyrococcus sp. NA2]|uniref:ABC transporter ATP-binding protein n=1 Tax=Pyrococcus sp. (strain NA2) TaxID=342949 RepID=UPI000209AE73|nr:ABC transporter ATP-binding protein [Pyrococcus sp. NA2]AEC51670.1 ABC-type multidrug transport system, ATPase component [Pyrococcus sp. NA2]